MHSPASNNDKDPYEVKCHIRAQCGRGVEFHHTTPPKKLGLCWTKLKFSSVGVDISVGVQTSLGGWVLDFTRFMLVSTQVEILVEVGVELGKLITTFPPVWMFFSTTSLNTLTKLNKYCRLLKCHPLYCHFIRISNCIWF